MEILLSLRTKAKDAAEHVFGRVVPSSLEGRSLSQIREGAESSSQHTPVIAGLEQHFEVRMHFAK